MKILAIRSAKTIWLIPTYFLNPNGMYLLPAIDDLKNRYQFQRSPLDGKFPPPQNEGYRFEHGAFNGKNGVVQIVHLTAHSDGLVVETRSTTDDGDDFLKEVLAFLGKEFGMPALDELPINKIYANELNVLFEKPPALLNPKYAPFFAAVASEIGHEENGGAPLLSLDLGTDQTKSKSPRTFTIAREVNTPIEENRFFSFAPVKTSVHIALLEKLEKLNA